MKRRSMLCQSVKRVPLPRGSSSHRISLPPQLYSSTSGASARVTVVWETCSLGVATVVSFTVAPTLPRLPSASKGAHSRRCAGSVRASHTFSGEWHSSRTRISVHFSSPFGPRSFFTRAPLAGPGAYDACSLILLSPFASPACQLRELNEVAAGVLQHRNGRTGHGGRRHGELSAARLDPLVVTVDVVGKKHNRRLVLLKHRPLIGFGGGIVIQRQLQLDAIRIIRRSHCEPSKWALTEVS